MIAPASVQNGSRGLAHHAGSIREQRGREVAVAGIGEEDDDGLALIFRTLGQLNAAWSAAPEEMPTRTPSFLPTSLPSANASSFETGMISS